MNLIPLNTAEAAKASPPQKIPRRHDLDALRAFAMLLGIVLHGAMSFIPGFGIVWGVQDTQSNPLYGVLLSSIHGWRMPLFFLISGFFTAMLWSKRGSHELLVHRFKRIFLPMMLAMVTIIPLLWGVSIYVRSQPSVQATDNQASTSSDAPDRQSETREIDVFAAVATSDGSSLSAYLDQGGDVDAKNAQGSTPMHVACLFGRAEMAELLLDADANLDLRNNDGVRPQDLLALDWKTTAFIAQLVQLPIEQDDVIAGRKMIAASIGEKSGRAVAAIAKDEDNPQAVESPGIAGALIGLIFYFPVFHHLWFLWFLCWFVCGFVMVVKLAQALPVPAIPTALLTSVARYAWLIPLTAIPQFYMGGPGHTYGPQTSVGLLPLPAVFIYYAIFFGYGALYFASNDQDVIVGKGFWWKLPASILVLFPVGLMQQGADSTNGQILFAVMQVSYTWVMSFAMIGLFHRLCSIERFWIRYLSDSSYWLYLAHLPLIMLMQFFVSHWAIPSVAKFAFVCSVTTGLLLASYQLCVRSTWIGALLNGRRYPWRGTAAKPLDTPVG